MDTDSYYRYYYQSKPILICENTTVTYYRYWILSLILIIISILYAELTVIEHQSTQVVISRKTRSGAKQSFEPIYLAVEYVTCIVTPSYGSYHCFWIMIIRWTEYYDDDELCWWTGLLIDYMGGFGGAVSRVISSLNERCEQHRPLELSATVRCSSVLIRWNGQLIATRYWMYRRYSRSFWAQSQLETFLHFLASKYNNAIWSKWKKKVLLLVQKLHKPDQLPVVALFCWKCIVWGRLWLRMIIFFCYASLQTFSGGHGTRGLSKAVYSGLVTYLNFSHNPL